MKIGGQNEFWMIIGPVLAVALVATFTMGGPEDMIRVAERFATDGWDAVVRAFRR
ncbi:MAG: hypothetical protein AB7U83_14895 [Vicinamibacterales bacterium]